MKRFLAVLLTCALLLSCVSLAAADEKKTLTVWIPQYQFGDGISDQDFWDGVFDPRSSPGAITTPPSTPACSTMMAPTWCTSPTTMTL